MHKSRIQHIKFSHFFPADDPISVTIARLCILREDLLLETQAIRPRTVPTLDSNGHEWRRLYFWRNTFRTLENIRQAIHNLNCERTFCEALNKEPPAIQTGFKRLTKQLQKISTQFLKDLRNDLFSKICGMTLEDMFRKRQLLMR